MTGITNSQLNDLIDVTMVDFPKPSVADLLCGMFTDEESDIAINFIKKYYTKEEILAGLEEYTRRCELMLKLFGPKK